MKVTRRQLRQIIKEAGGYRDYSDDEVEYTSRAGTLYDELPGLDPDLLKGAYVSSKEDREAFKDYIAKVKEKRMSMSALGPADDHLESITSQDMADAKRHAKSDLPRDQADYLDISVEDWHRARQELDDHYEDRHMEDQMAFDDHRHPLDDDGDGNVDWDEISEMKITHRQLRRLIKEELGELNELFQGGYGKTRRTKFSADCKFPDDIDDDWKLSGSSASEIYSFPLPKKRVDYTTASNEAKKDALDQFIKKYSAGLDAKDKKYIERQAKVTVAPFDEDVGKICVHVGSFLPLSAISEHRKALTREQHQPRESDPDARQAAATTEFMEIMETPGLSSDFTDGQQRWRVQPDQAVDESAVPQDVGSFKDTLLLARLPRNEFQSISPASTRMMLEIRVDDEGEITTTVRSSADRRMVSQVQNAVDEIFEYDWPEDKRQVILDLAPGLNYQLESVPSNALMQISN
tara:strand:- start:2026 stop:3414 length:1389 start_codon:yes stop_codon:yes gene_type:complete